MALTPSTMLELGTEMPEFRLPDPSGLMFSSHEIRRDAPGVLVAFICPHCPYVRHIRNEFVRFANEYQEKGLVVVAINSNDAQAYPSDGPAGMEQEIQEAGYTFPYLFDETQRTAKEFHAACTPDFFLFDKAGKLVYRGQFDNSRPGNTEPISGSDLRAAADAVLAGRAPTTQQQPSVGCNIKWKTGNAPEYFTA